MASRKSKCQKWLAIAFLLGCQSLLVGMVTLVCGSVVAASSIQDGGTPEQKTEALLDRLGFGHLQIRHLENQLATFDSLGPAQQSIAEKLLRLYSQQLMRASEVSGRLDYGDRAKGLLVQFPELKKATIQLAIAQSDYQLLEQAFRDWQQQGAKLTSRPPLNQRWQALTLDLKSILDELTSKYDQQLALLRDDRQADSDQLLQLETALARTSYLLGWSHYYAGVLGPQVRKQQMQQADLQFRRFLQLDPEKVLLTIDENWLDFESVFQRRALVGLAMSQLGLNHPDQSDYCFQLFEPHADRFQLRAAMYRWRLNSYANLDQFDEVKPLAEQAINDDSLSSRQRVQVALEVWHLAFAFRDRQAQLAASLRTLAAVELVRERQMKWLQGQLELESKLDTVTTLDKLFPDPFSRNWIQAYVLSGEAKLSKDARNRAIDLLDQANELAKTKRSNLDSLMIQLMKFQLLFQANDAGEGARQQLDQLNRLAIQLKTAGRIDLAEEATWLAVKLASRIAQSEPRSNLAVNQINRFLSEHPDSSSAPVARMMQMKLVTQRYTPERAIEAYQALTRDPQTASSAWLEIANLEFRRWSSDPSVETWKTFQNSLEEVWSQPQLKDTTRIQSNLLMAQAMIKNEGFTNDKIHAWLEGSVQSLIEKLPVDQAQRPRFSAAALRCRCQLALRNNDLGQAVGVLEKLAAEFGDTPSFRAATFDLAARIDPSWTKGTAQNSAKELAQRRKWAIFVFSQVVQITGDSDEQLLQNVNARVGCFRLASLQVQVGQTEPASRMAQRLVKLFPKRKEYRRLLAAVWQHSGNFSQALPEWKRIADSSRAGQSIWYESRLRMVECLRGKQDDGAAAKLLKQIKLLGAEVPSEWQKLFHDLSKELNVD